MRVLLALLTYLTASGCAGAGWEPPPRTPAPEPTVSSHRTLTGYQGKDVRLMVQEGAYGMQERALQEHDFKTLGWIWETYEYLDVPTGTPARIVRDTPGGVQVELADGTEVGRRGWLAPSYLSP